MLGYKELATLFGLQSFPIIFVRSPNIGTGLLVLSILTIS
jgi:hypothetical protein